jgi:hypothetical protein
VNTQQQKGVNIKHQHKPTKETLNVVVRPQSFKTVHSKARNELVGFIPTTPITRVAVHLELRTHEHEMELLKS